MDLASLTSWLTVWSPTLLLTAGRVGGLLMAGPVFSHAAVGTRVRIALALVIAVAVAVGMPAPVVVAETPLGIAVQFALEVLLGVALGYAGRILFVGAEIGALHIGRQIGVDLGPVYRVTRDELSSPVVRLFQMVLIVIFLGIGGHRDLIGAAIRSFQLLPSGTLLERTRMAESMVGLFGVTFVVALRVAGPMLVAMLLATAGMGLLQRALPQCNILSTNLPVRAAVGLAVLAATLGVLVPVADAAWTGITRQLLTALNGAS